jgi:hypothetical protein
MPSLLNERSPNICEVDISASPHSIKGKFYLRLEMPDSTRAHSTRLDDRFRGILCCLNRPLILGISPFVRRSRDSVSRSLC